MPLAAKAAIWVLVLLAYVAWFWPVIYSALSGGGGAWVAPSQMVAAAGIPILAKKLWIAAGITAAIPLLMFLATLFRPRKLHGDAKFGGEQDARRAGLRAKQGIVLGMFKRRPLVADAPGHVFIAMPSGGGKSAAIAVPTLLQWRGSVIALDTKRELFHLTAGFRAKFGPVFLFDPLSESGQTHRFNPLDRLGSDVQRINRVRKVAEMLIALPQSGDPYWASAARDLLSGVILALADRRDAWDAKDGPMPLLTLGEVYRQLLGENIQIAAKRLAGYTRTELAYKLLMDFAAMAQKQSDGVKGMVISVLSLWGIPAIDQATSVSDFDFENLRRKPSSIYLATSPSDLPRLAPLFALMSQQVLDALCARLPQDDEPFELLQLLDEFAQLGRMETLSRGFDFLRGYNCRIVAIVQAPSQLDVHYGREGRKIIIQNCRVRVMAAPNDPDVARELSEELGYQTVSSKSRTMGAGGKGSTTVSQAKRALLLPQEVRELSRENLLVLAEGTRPLRVDKSWFFRDPALVRRTQHAPPALPTRTIEMRMRTSAVDDAAASGELAKQQAALVETKVAELFAKVVQATAENATDSGVAKSLKRRVQRARAQPTLEADAAAAAALLLEPDDGQN